MSGLLRMTTAMMKAKTASDDPPVDPGQVQRSPPRACGTLAQRSEFYPGGGARYQPDGSDLHFPVFGGAEGAG
ncbi:MAG: hypothetical protein MZU95_01390 [Desulfomicrobium escambiense]|nr:hypothetical protein [Desulfomicrobium escambiense]